ncbi:transposase [Fusobacterium polymorphum]|uniref:Transposase n=1 Tax=Fusobacterium nucleatum subsp. polymorphum TaxID=76857 RepID=A0A2B7YHR2_FUSNP|nr:helix-turn-helix domain-containing protein [Fusobacterium polymorphum]PGH20619.1 transposase [Fusobacterium polymorphum]
MITIAKSKYETDVKPRLVEIEAWKRDGLTDEQICKNLGISVDTFYRYKAKYSEFSEAIKKGKEVADIEVENALFKRAIGYTYKEITKEVKDIDGKKSTFIKEITKAVPGDVAAQIFWLKNRKSNNWKDKRENENDDTKLIEVLDKLEEKL